MAGRLRITALSILLTAGLPGIAAAEEPAAVAAGRQIAAGETVAADLACQRCHGLDGAGGHAEAAPRIAGQSRFYLLKQLDDFAGGTRPSRIMAPIAAALTPAERAAAAAWFASRRDVPFPAQPPADGALLQQGAALSGAGDAGRRIRPCAHCHAPAGRGLPPSFPYLAGQFAAYTAEQLRRWRAGQRRNDPLDVMAEIARAMSEEEIRATALYFARVRPPLDSLNRAVPAEPLPPAE